MVTLLDDALMTRAPREIVLVHLFELPSSMANVVQTLATASALARRGHVVHLYLRAGGDLDLVHHLQKNYGVEPGLPLTIHRLPRHKGLSGLLLRLSMLRQFLRSKPPAFLSRSARHAQSLVAFRRLLGRRSPLVHEFHNLEHVLAAELNRAEKAEMLKRSEARLVAACDGLIAISQPLANDLRETLQPAVPLEVIEDGVDLEAFATAVVDKRPSPGTHIVYAGSFFSHKGVESLVRAMIDLPAQVTLELVGGHPSDELARLKKFVAEHESLATRVTFRGAVPASEVPLHLQSADLIVLPAGSESRSQRYTSPLKLFEAMATGVPIVAAPTAALVSVLRSGVDAIIARDCDAAGLAMGIRQALDDPPAARAMGRAAAQRAKDFSWNKRGERIAEFLDRLARS